MTEIGITTHAHRRLSERLPGMSELEYERFLRQAWASRQDSQTLMMLRMQNTEPRYKTKYKYRLHAGMVVVFQYIKQIDKAIIITLFKHQDPDSTQLYQDFNRWAEGPMQQL